MITYEATIAKDSWTELLNGETTLSLDIAGNHPIGLHFSESLTAPPLDAPINIVFPHKGNWDFQTSGLAAGQKLFAKGISNDVEVTVVR